jgi:phospholipase C
LARGRRAPVLVGLSPTFLLFAEKTISLENVSQNSVVLSPSTIAVTATLQDAVLLLDRQSHQLLRHLSMPRSTLPPIEHIVYIMKENRTYNQVLGDLPQGIGDPSLCLFPDRITPNHHQLARDFVLFDNFYVNADVSSEGWH